MDTSIELIECTITSRPSVGGLPSETELYHLNESRKKLLKIHLGENVFPGTLNLKVSRKYIDLLQSKECDFSEEPINNPSSYKSLSETRGGYKYYKATLKLKRIRVPGVVRICRYHTSKAVSFICSIDIKNSLHLMDDTKVYIKHDFKDVNVQPIAKLPAHDYLKIFYNENDIPVNLNDMYKNGHIFLIASGPSFADFKEKDKLKYVATMGINNSPKAMMPYFRPTLWTCVDPPIKFLYTIWKDPQTMKIVPSGHRNRTLWNQDKKESLSVKVKECPNTFFVHLNNHFNKETYLTEESVNWGNNPKHKSDNGVGGKRSVFMSALKQLYILGFTNVYLLGVDFKMEEGKANYSFEQSRSIGSIKGNNSSYAQMQYWFSQLNPIFKKHNFNVYNCNLESGLTAFEFMSFDDAYKRALSHVGNVDKYINNELEDTKELYNKTWYKCKDCNKDQFHDESEVKLNKVKCISCDKMLEITERFKK